jgi:phenylacetic acid degradation operon negative regulatory protein
MVTSVCTTVTERDTSPLRLARGRGVGQVAFLFGLARRTELPGPVLRRMLVDCGLSPDATRALLARMVRAGELNSHRSGRTTAYALAGDLLAGFERVRDQAMTRPRPWTGQFHTVLHAVPEEHRAFRDALRRAAVLAGYGTLQPGVLISSGDRHHVLAPLLGAVPAGARVHVGTLGLGTAEAAGAAATAWDLAGLAATYRDHVVRLDAARPDDLRTFVEAYQPALTDTLREPALDPVLLPPDWPGRELRAAFGRFEAAHGDVVEHHLARLGVTT